MASLRWLSQDGRSVEREIAIQTDEVTIGRDRDNAVVVQGAAVSRRHARILATARGFMLVDADSANGVWIGDQRVRHHFLVSGDVFRVGAQLLQFIDRDPRAAFVEPGQAAGLAPRAVVPGATLCGRCGAAMAPGITTCSECGTSILAARPRRRGLWIGCALLLLMGAGVTGLALYFFRAAWLPAVAGMIGRGAGTTREVQDVAPELLDFGSLAHVRETRSWTVGQQPSRHSLDSGTDLVVPAGAFTARQTLETAVVALDLASANSEVRGASVYVVGAPAGTRLAERLVLEVAKPPSRVTVAEHQQGAWRPIVVPEGPSVRVAIDHFSRRTFAIVEWKRGPALIRPDGEAQAPMAGDTVSGADSSALPPPTSAPAAPVGAATPAAAPTPPNKRLEDDPSYQRWIGTGPARYWSGRLEFCTVLTARVLHHPGLSFGLPSIGGRPAPRPEAGLPEGTPFEALMIAAVDPKSQDKNVYVRLTNEPPGDGDARSCEQRLEDAILASSGNLTPADVMEMALQASGGNYPLATLVAHNLLKNIAYQGRQQQRLIGGLMSRGRQDVSFPERYGAVSGKLVNLRSAPGDKMGIWYHAFVPLAIASWTGDPSEADSAIFKEYAVRWLGSLTNMGSPMDEEKRASDKCFAQSAHDVRNAQALAEPPTKPPAPPPPPPPPPVPRPQPGQTTPAAPCPSLERRPHKCPWTPEGYSVGACTPGFCWDGGPQGALACKQENGVPNSGRSYTTDLLCSAGFTAVRDSCTGVILRCEKP